MRLETMKVMMERLTETRSRLLKEMTILNDKEFNTVSREDVWSIAQICHHLYLAEKTFTKAILYGLNKDGQQDVDPKPIHLLADRSKKIDAPKMVIPSEDHFEIQQMIDMLEEARIQLINVLNSIKDESVLSKKAVRHPLFGYLPLYQWVETVYLHEQRHIEQIQEIKALICR